MRLRGLVPQSCSRLPGLTAQKQVDSWSSRGWPRGPLYGQLASKSLVSTLQNGLDSCGSGENPTNRPQSFMQENHAESYAPNEYLWSRDTLAPKTGNSLEGLNASIRFCGPLPREESEDRCQRQCQIEKKKKK